jgi:hypothetical protein
MRARLLPIVAAFLAPAAAFILLASPTGAAQPTPPTPVVRGPADENHATAGWNRAGTILYVAFTRRDPDTGRTTAHLRSIRRDGSFRSMKLNLRGQGEAGGFFHGRRVLYSETKGGDLDLRVYDIPTGRRTTLTDVNTRKHEWLATRSGPYLLFNRDDAATRVVLRDVRDGTETLLAHSRNASAFAGQVSGNWAVWMDCTPDCDVYKRDIAAGTTAVVPKPAADPGLVQYDPSVTGDGTVYLVRSGDQPCESTVELVRYAASDPPEGTVIAQLPTGRFTTGTYARRTPGGAVDIFFARGSCATFTHDIFKLRYPPP